LAVSRKGEKNRLRGVGGYAILVKRARDPGTPKAPKGFNALSTKQKSRKKYPFLVHFTWEGTKRGDRGPYCADGYKKVGGIKKKKRALKLGGAANGNTGYG